MTPGPAVSPLCLEQQSATGSSDHAATLSDVVMEPGGSASFLPGEHQLICWTSLRWVDHWIKPWGLLVFKASDLLTISRFISKGLKFSLWPQTRVSASQTFHLSVKLLRSTLLLPVAIYAWRRFHSLLFLPRHLSLHSVTPSRSPSHCPFNCPFTNTPSPSPPPVLPSVEDEFPLSWTKTPDSSVFPGWTCGGCVWLPGCVFRKWRGVCVSVCESSLHSEAWSNSWISSCRWVKPNVRNLTEEFIYFFFLCCWRWILIFNVQLHNNYSIFF